MQVAIISVGVGILLFFISFLGFRTGLRLGMQSAKGIVPPKIDLINAVKETVVKPPELPNEIMKGYANMMAFNGEVKEEK